MMQNNERPYTKIDAAQNFCKKHIELFGNSTKEG